MASYGLPVHVADGASLLRRETATGALISPVALLIGAALALAALVFMRAAASRSRASRRMADERARELCASNMRLIADIAARKRAEQELRHAQHVLTVAQKVAHMGSWELDALTGELQCSDELFRICGLAPQSVRPTVEFILGMAHPDDREAARRAIATVHDEGKDFRLEKRIVRPDGSIRHVISIGEATRDDRGQLVRVAGSMLDITEQKETELALRQSQDELRQLAAYQERIREDERKHIAREVHDELGGLLTGIKAYLSVSMERTDRLGSSPDLLLSAASGLADQASDTVRRIITDLRPSVLDQLGVWAALQWYAERVEKRTGIVCDFMLSDSAAALHIDPDRSIVLFRIVQEALTNVVRHANAAWALIRVTRQDACVIVEIEDDGQGFDPALTPAPDAWGVVGMHERARYFGGRFDISCIPGKGTTARLRLPIDDSHCATK